MCLSYVYRVTGLSERANPHEREDAMKIRIIIILLGVACLAGYVTAVWNNPDPISRPHSVARVSDVPTLAAALAGTWEGLRSHDLPARLVVKDVRERWATVFYNWGEHPEGKFQKGWVRVRAVVFPDGKLFWRHPGDFTFQLSDDWTTLVCTRQHGGQTVTSLLRRVPAWTALGARRVGTDS